MAVSTQNGVTMITPTAWKWYVGAVPMILSGLVTLGRAESMITLVCLAAGAMFVVVGAGLINKTVLTPTGISFKKLGNVKQYRWEDIGEIRIVKITSGLITVSQMVNFTHTNLEGTMLGKTAKLLGGGTNGVQAVGISAKKLAELMTAYKMGYVPHDTVADAPAFPQQLEAMQPAAAPVAQPMSAQRSQPVRPAPAAAPGGFGRKSSTPAIAGGTQLVQEPRRLFGRKPDTPFG